MYIGLVSGVHIPSQFGTTDIKCMMAITLLLLTLLLVVSIVYRALTTILQSHGIQILIPEIPSLRHSVCASNTYQILSPVQSLHFLLLIYSMTACRYNPKSVA